jgi:hypothetical protein
LGTRKNHTLEIAFWGIGVKPDPIDSNLAPRREFSRAQPWRFHSDWGDPASKNRAPRWIKQPLKLTYNLPAIATMQGALGCRIDAIGQKVHRTVGKPDVGSA